MTKILVAEDNPSNLELIRELVKSLGHEVIEALDGQDALRKIAETQPDLVLLDIQMPVLSGFCALEKIREDPRLRNLRVVALTAYAMKGDRENALAAGFDAYITKPISSSEFRRVIQQQLSEPK